MKKFLFLFLFLYFFINFIDCQTSYSWNIDYNLNENYFFQDQANWLPVGVPGALDDATVINGGIVTNYLQNTKVNKFNLYDGYLINIGIMNITDSFTNFGFVMLYNGGGIESKDFSTMGLTTCSQYDKQNEFDCYLQHSEINMFIGSRFEVNDLASLSLYNDSITMISNSRIVSGLKSHIALKGNGIIMMEESSIVNSKGGSFYFDNNVTLTDTAYIRVSNCIINQFGYMSFLVNSSMVLEDKSKLYSEDSLWVFDDGCIVVNTSSTAFFKKEVYFADSSYLFVTGGSIVWIQGELFASLESILSAWEGSVIYIQNNATFGSVILESSTLIVENTCFIDGVLFIDHGKIVVNGVFTYNALAGLFINATVENTGDFDLFGNIMANFTKFEITKGNFNVYDYAFLVLYDSSVKVDGFIYISNESYIEIERTDFFVSDMGQMESKGNIYLNQETNFNNVGTLNIHSGIYYTKDLSIKTSDVAVSNSGTFNVKEKININVGFNNKGTLNVNKNELFVYDYSQTNGSIQLSGGSISSDKHFKINGGLVEGSGSINNSVSQTNGVIGSKSKINNIKVNGNLIATESSKMIFVVDSIESFSTLDILDDIDYNGEIEIRFSIDFIQDLQSGKLKLENKTSQLNTNNLQLASSSSSSSSSSSDDSLKINLINFKSNKNKNGLNNVLFKTYDPKNSNDEAKNYDGCGVSTSKSDKSFSLLFNGNSCGGGSKLKGGIIAAIVISCAVVVVLVALVVHYRERLRFFSKTSKVGTKFKSFRKSIRNSVSLKSTNKENNA
ncbi:hypothetical protein DICPUDRAFT_147052 [Dictyostelium purpureum]|uniref:Right handed beta helix domain-containing protein n=1 Tax=Dictyostelium purpureum TaxID=5786 RepID=F0Z7J1_DICPU|nr:uncharacterized protein DICPUDRAFT_147052 [Dictyostelium purpureum]EGC40027.1 hypothetical protein DICPUDRAFT_147052 [Dictyostelium purpureum]|eukprot:XP_003283376.1 hypothetical protein DICPUDRAFT_147052 [Dictyostelium purpureum]